MLLPPGPLDLPSVRDMVPADRLETIINTMIPVKKLGDPHFVAQIVLKLIRVRTQNFVTGATWDINGGIFYAIETTMTAQNITVQIISRTVYAGNIVLLELARPDGGDLPDFDAGGTY